MEILTKKIKNRRRKPEKVSPPAKIKGLFGIMSFAEAQSIEKDDNEADNRQQKRGPYISGLSAVCGSQAGKRAVVNKSAHHGGENRTA